MDQIAWKLLNDGTIIQLFHIDGVTHEVTKVESLKFRNRKTFEEAFRFIRANYLTHTNYVSQTGADAVVAH